MRKLSSIYPRIALVSIGLAWASAASAHAARNSADYSAVKKRVGADCKTSNGKAAEARVKVNSS
jgi:hypothetical protein